MFTFKLTDKHEPIITIDGKPLHIVSFFYGWKSPNVASEGYNAAEVHGYIGSEPTLRHFDIDFRDNLIDEYENVE